MAGIDPNLYIKNNPAAVRQTGNSSLGKDDFLKILMAQLQNQDPLNPMEDKDFVAQMAQFSSLEQITNMTASIEKLVAAQQTSQMIGFESFMGKEVVWHKLSEEVDEDGNPIVSTGTGKIASIKFGGDTAQFVLEDGTVLNPENISELKQSASSIPVAAASAGLADASSLIGKTITWEANGQTLTDTVQSASMKDGKTVLSLLSGGRISYSDLISSL